MEKVDKRLGGERGKGWVESEEEVGWRVGMSTMERGMSTVENERGARWRMREENEGGARLRVREEHGIV